jgi:DNA-binding response OmpR family regulator
MAAVLVIEDDQRIREVLARGLTGAGHAVRTEATGGGALAVVVEWRPDVVVLDLGLPDLDGRDVLRMLRGVSAVPVIVATARDDEREIVHLLDAGADDYVVKPYSTAQIEARIRAMLRRGPRDGPGAGPAGGGGPSGTGRATELRCGGLVVDPARRTARLDGHDLDLTRLEFDLLACLVRRSPEVVSRRELLAEVWRQPYGGADKTVDVHLSWLRRKLGETASEPRYLHTVRGVGIKLDPPTVPAGPDGS